MAAEFSNVTYLSFQQADCPGILLFQCLLLSNKLEKWLIKPSYFQKKKKNQLRVYHFLFEKKIWNRICKFRSLLENSASRRSDDFYLDFI